jgi:hypothetical protein
LNIAYIALVFPRLPPKGNSAPEGLLVFAVVLLLSLAVAIFDIRKGFKKHLQNGKPNDPGK